MSPIPLKRVLVTRSSGQASTLANLLRTRNLDPILIPTIELTDPTSFTTLDTALSSLEAFHWLLFTSANAVEAFHRRLLASWPLALHPLPSIAAIGPATARALSGVGLTPTLLPPHAVAESLADSLLAHALQPDGTPTRFLLIRAEEARDVLPDRLRAAGADVTIAPAYRNVLPASSLQALHELFAHPAAVPDAITFTSSSTAINFFTLAEAAGVQLPTPGPILASIGPVTSATLRDLNHPPGLEAPQATIDSLVEILVKTLYSSKLE